MKTATHTEKHRPSLDAAHWLLTSGIQDLGSDSDTRGGVNAWWDLRTESYSFIYGEITGYAVNAYLFFYEATEDKSFLEAARRAGDWLIHNSVPGCGLIKNRVNQPGFQVRYYDSWLFTFDQWISVYGLACLAGVTGESRYLDKARSVADFLIQNTVRRDGAFEAVYDSSKKKALSTKDKWSRQSGGFHAKALMALHKLRELSGRGAYAETAARLAVWTLKNQLKSGRFVTQDSDRSTHLHPHLYTVEGLIAHGLAVKDTKSLGAAARALEWVFKHQHADGRIDSYYKNDAFVPYVRCDIMAQALRTASILEQHKIWRAPQGALDKLRSAILAHQILEGAQKGGFLYGAEQDGTIHYHINSWVTMFAAQALWIHDGIARQRKAWNMAFFV